MSGLEEMDIVPNCPYCGRLNQWVISDGIWVLSNKMQNRYRVRFNVISDNDILLDDKGMPVIYNATCIPCGKVLDWKDSTWDLLTSYIANAVKNNEYYKTFDDYLGDGTI